VVFAELHTVTVRETVSFHRARERFDEHGAPREANAVNTAATVLLDQLSWWAHTPFEKPEQPAPTAHDTHYRPQ
jgi:hypothetical protein